MKYGFLLLVTFLVVSCSKENQYLNRLEGDWNIENLVRTEIHWDGTINVLSDETDAGEFSMVVSTLGDLTLDNLLDLTFSSVEHGQPFSAAVVIKVDEQAKRVIALGGDCIQCDLAYTIEENKPNRQVWSTFSADEANQLTYKLSFTLKRK
ncbi:MAG: hypothetical protein IPL49_03980 [Saprospirales bacterium]|nr:hypothetical protein [Saprospirales bacterium]